jgi:FMN-dependent NADH-azoreductase
MKTLLQIQTSLLGSKGQSSQLADRFVANWLARHPDGQVITRDLSAEPVPHLTAERFQAFGTKAEERTADQGRSGVFRRADR